MPTRKVEKKVEATTETPRGLISHYGMGWKGTLNMETSKDAPVDEKHADRHYVHVRSTIDNLVHCGRYFPK